MRQPDKWHLTCGIARRRLSELRPYPHTGSAGQIDAAGTANEEPGGVIVRRRRILALVTVSSLVLSIGLAVAPVSAGPPTEIGVSPHTGYLNTYCEWAQPSERMYWTVGVWGGTTGSFMVTVYYGDGSPGNTSYHPGTYDTHHDFACGGNRTYGQTWSAARGGGGTGRDTSAVHVN